MSSNSIDLQSLREFEKNLRKVDDFTDEAIVEGLEIAAQAIANHAKAEHSQRPKGIKDHPSERFYTIRGVTAASIHPGEVKASKGGASVSIISPEPHSAALEKGTPTAPAYPFMEPALEATQDEVFKILQSAISRALGG